LQFSIKNLTRQSVPKIGFESIAEKILGKKYELSVVFVSHATSKRLNSSFRGKDKPTNILSFPLSKNSGEIFIDLKKVRAEYKNFGMNFKKFTVFIFIHGLLHLKGMEHGARMERAEKKWLAKLS
jgi:probable rRNA maturation factor